MAFWVYVFRIRKGWQKYTEELYKKGLNYLDNHDGVVADLDLDILGCEVKEALGSITMNKASGGDGIPAELLKIFLKKMMLLKCFSQYIIKFGKLSRATGLEKVSFHDNPKEEQCQRMFKLPYNCTHFMY